MKRTWIGAGVLVFLLFAGLLSARWMDRQHTPPANLLEQAARAALDDQWEQARSLAGQAERLWEKNRNLTAALSDHTPMEEIDESFAELSVFSAAGEPVHFAALCRSLSQKMEAMGDAHRLSWWNIF